MGKLSNTNLIAGSTRQSADSEPRWSQEEAIAFECAREYLSDIMGLYSHKLSDEETRDLPSEDRITWLRAEIARLGELRSQLRVKDHSMVAQVRSAYGELWRRLVEI